MYSGKAQVFTGAGGPIQDDGNDTFFPMNVSGLNPANIDNVFGLEQVCFSINHPAVSELYIYLVSPTGVMVNLTLGNSSYGPDFVNTCLDNSAGTSITLGTPPYTGTFLPVSYLGRFNTGVTGNGTWQLIVHDGFPGINTGVLVSWSIQFGVQPAAPVAFNTSNLPIVFINTPQTITEVESSATVGIVSNASGINNVIDTWNNYSGKVGINVRGNSTKNFEKKSYSFETQDASGNPVGNSILGMPVETDWVLGASYIDKTLLRIPLAFHLARGMGRYASRIKHVELVVNNEYRGMYTMMERPKRDINRINIKKLEATDEVFPDVTGGYVIKIDRPDEQGWFSQFPGNSPINTKFYYQYVYPRDIDINASQKTYIQGFMNNFESLMNSPAYADPNTGYASVIDVASFVDFFIINELSKNVDAYKLSTYLYKDNIDQGGKLFIGPVWDYDIAWHNCNYGAAFDPAGWAYQNQVNDFPAPTWWIKLMNDPAFVNKLHCRWYTLRENILSLSTMYNYIDSSAAAITDARDRNFKQWPIMGAFIYPNPQNQAGANYATEIADLKSWLANRVAWMDANIGGTCPIGLSEEIVYSDLKVFPNPMQQSTTFSLDLDQNSDVTLCITDLVGKEVARYLNTNVPSGHTNIVFEKKHIRSGIYLYQLQINNSIRTGKIIVL